MSKRPRQSRSIFGVVLVLACGMLAVQAHSALDPVAEGEARFHQASRASFDPYTDNPTDAEQAWMREHYHRMQTFSPYFDSRLSWFPNAWVYRNAYAIFPDSSTFEEHPDWVLRDVDGNLLYIPFDCENGACPQFAGDVGNAAFRANWIARAQELIAVGYTGIWLDDVNLDWRVSDGDGDFVNPIDPRTDLPMTLEDWQRYFAEFVEQIRLALPDIEIAHNVLWFAGSPANDNPFIERQIDASDFIHLERGAADTGLVGGNDPFGFELFLGFVDYVHSRSRSVILMDEGSTLRQRELALGGWLLVSAGTDLVGSENLDWVAPDTWWHGYDVDLGAAAGPRYQWGSLLRRDFQCGIVLVNQPDMPIVTADLSATYTTLDNVPVASVELHPASAAILLAPCVEVANVTDTAALGSSDPSGVGFLPEMGTLLVSDSEVDETPFFAGVNIFQLDAAGDLLGQLSTIGFSNEPSGITFNAYTGTVFIVDDDLKKVLEMDISTPPGQLLSSLSLAGLGILDSEGISFDPATGNLFVLDGADGSGGTGTVYEITTAGDLISSQFVGDVAADPEGIYFDPVRDSFFVVSGPDRSIFEIARAGGLIATYDIQPIRDTYGHLRAKGITLAPTSDPDDAPAARNLYFADQGFDELNDGRLFEISLNHPPVGDTDADGIVDSQDNCVLAVNSAQADSDGDGIGSVCDADFNNDCIVNAADLGLMRGVFFSDDPIADMNSDGIVNIADLGLLKGMFFMPPGPSAGPALCTGN